MAHELILFPTDAELAKSTAAQWVAILRSRKDPAKSYNVAISGGRIAKNFFAEVARQAGSAAIFQNVNFFWADERCVPPSDPESNYALARQTLLEPLKIPGAQIHRLRGEGPEAAALQEAIAAICKSAPMANGQPVLDIIFLGMGENGHIASLFPEETEAEMANPAIYRAVTTVKPPPRRFTLGYAAIAAALEVWVVAAGVGKQEALRDSVSPNGKTPLARVLRQRAQTKIFTDIKL